MTLIDGGTRRVPSACALLALPFLLLQASCNEPELESSWIDGEFAVDGSVDDWLGPTSYFEDEQVTVGIKNDDRTLVLGLSSGNPAVLIMTLMQGLTIWFDPQGGEERGFGIRFPLGAREMDFDLHNEGQRLTPSRLLDMYRRSPPELRIISGPSESQLMEAVQAIGIEVAIDEDDGSLAYELRVPLERSEMEPFAVGAKPGAVIGIGIEVPEMDRSVLRGSLSPGGEREGGPRGGPSSGGGSGGRRGRMGTGRGIHGKGMVKSLDLWAKVRLAEQPDSLLQPKTDWTGSSSARFPGRGFAPGSETPDGAITPG